MLYIFIFLPVHLNESNLDLVHYDYVKDLIPNDTGPTAFFNENMTSSKSPPRASNETSFTLYSTDDSLDSDSENVQCAEKALDRCSSLLDTLLVYWKYLCLFK